MPPGAFVGRIAVFVTGGFHFTFIAGRFAPDFMPALELGFIHSEIGAWRRSLNG